MTAAWGYAETVDTRTAARRYEARPGRAAVVAADLADLRGPASGRVTLPLRLFWSPAGRSWNLDEPALAQEMYEHILGQAIREQELTEWLSRDLLIAVWPQLYLPKGIRRAWEERHPSLRPSAAA